MKPDRVCTIVMACAVLHNIAIERHMNRNLKKTKLILLSWKMERTISKQQNVMGQVVCVPGPRPPISVFISRG
jgi:hypothetical protein